MPANVGQPATVCCTLPVTIYTYQRECMHVCMLVWPICVCRQVGMHVCNSKIQQVYIRTCIVAQTYMASCMHAHV